MKPQLLKVPLLADNSFSVRRDVTPYFYNRWHYHPEIELVYIESGSGTQFVGDSIQHFGPGDVLLVGANLPHYWRCDEVYFARQEGLFAQATVVHFRPDFWGDVFMGLPENRLLGGLLEKARQGLRVQGHCRDQVVAGLRHLAGSAGIDRLIRLLQILALLAQSDELEVLCRNGYSPVFDDADTDRINQIYAYSLANFGRKISLDEIAAVANISPNSFCRYFKSRNRKSYSQFLLELRIQHACKLLMEGNLSVAQVCYESGFNQFSGFNKYFRQITGKSPTEYRRLVAEK
ncbi:AraC family transcriptional regulator [Rudanella lutea]|uniref:AraC family transcriptional regulator n=1 Tax=Rudanella lutea TaxID=451374 RepID=UPI00037C2D95|nr:AraC family transcriptional regulator [Rudanella lutea]